jgi:tryptophan 2,3-dioxygenase
MMTPEEWEASREASLLAIEEKFREEIWRQLCLFLGKEAAFDRLSDFVERCSPYQNGKKRRRRSDPTRTEGLRAYDAAPDAAAKKVVVEETLRLLHSEPTDIHREQLKKWFTQTRSKNKDIEKKWKAWLEENPPARAELAPKLGELLG